MDTAIIILSLTTLVGAVYGVVVTQKADKNAHAKEMSSLREQDTSAAYADLFKKFMAMQDSFNEADKAAIFQKEEVERLEVELSQATHMRDLHGDALVQVSGEKDKLTAAIKDTMYVLSDEITIELMRAEPEKRILQTQTRKAYKYLYDSVNQNPL